MGKQKQRKQLERKAVYLAYLTNDFTEGYFGICHEIENMTDEELKSYVRKLERKTK